MGDVQIVAGIKKRRKRGRVRLYLPDVSMDKISDEVNETNTCIMSNPNIYDHYITNLYFDPETDRYIIYYDDIAKGEGGGKIQIISNPPTGSYLVKDMVYNSESGRFMIEHNET